MYMHVVMLCGVTVYKSKGYIVHACQDFIYCYTCTLVVIPIKSEEFIRFHEVSCLVRWLMCCLVEAEKCLGLLPTQSHALILVL